MAFIILRNRALVSSVLILFLEIELSSEASALTSSSGVELTFCLEIELLRGGFSDFVSELSFRVERPPIPAPRSLPKIKQTEGIEHYPKMILGPKHAAACCHVLEGVQRAPGQHRRCGGHVQQRPAPGPKQSVRLNVFLSSSG